MANDNSARWRTSSCLTGTIISPLTWGTPACFLLLSTLHVCFFNVKDMNLNLVLLLDTCQKADTKIHGPPPLWSETRCLSHRHPTHTPSVSIQPITKLPQRPLCALVIPSATIHIHHVSVWTPRGGVTGPPPDACYWWTNPGTGGVGLPPPPDVFHLLWETSLCLALPGDEPTDGSDLSSSTDDHARALCLFQLETRQPHLQLLLSLQPVWGHETHYSPLLKMFFTTFVSEKR